jgi:hypothetical protein
MNSTSSEGSRSLGGQGNRRGCRWTARYKLRRGSTDSGDGVANSGEQESEGHMRERERELGEEERKGVRPNFIEEREG